MTTHSHSHSSKSPAIGSELLAEHRKEMDALSDEEVLTPNVDVAAAANTAIGAMPAIEMQREALVAQFGKQAKTALDGLVPVARLSLAANAMYATHAEKDLEADAQRVREMRDALANAVTAFIARGLVDSHALDRLTGGSSYHALVTDVLAIVSWFGTNASAIESHSKVTREELASAYLAAEKLAADLATRDQTRAGTSEPALDRARAFTLFFRNYDGIRKMLGYLRWHQGDADAIAPSVHVRRRLSKSDAGQGDTGATSVGTTLAPTHDALPGLPGSNPFHT